MAAERQGWNTWDRYLEAGIVDETIMFTDNQIITDHAIGKTRDTIGKCYPIDAAVAYSLASAGPNADLSAKDLVNQYTRAATAMMSQTVAYGKVPNPETKSCGHDEVSGVVCKFGYPMLDDNGLISLTPNKGMRSWLIENPDITGLNSYSKFRTNNHWSQIIEGNGSGSIISVLLSKKYTPLRLMIEKTLGSTKWDLNPHQSKSLHSVQGTKGVCKWADDSEKTCGHHDGSYITGWVMVKAEDEDRYEMLWSRERGEAVVEYGWHHDQIAGKYGYNGYKNIAHSRIVLWSQVARGLGNIMEDKRVVKQINGALRRMSARNMNVVTKEGLRNKARYTWKNWDWLFTLQNWIAQTSKKNRKEHDLVNGWKYTKYESKMSYGHEIASFKWVPGKKNVDYHVDTNSTVAKAVVDKESVKSFHVRYQADRWNTLTLPFRFPDLKSALNFKNMSSQLACKLGAVNKDGRTWDGASGAETILASKQMTIGSTIHMLEMDANQVPEVIPEPKDVLLALVWGTPQDYDKHIEYLNEKSMKLFLRPQILNDSDVTKDVTE